MTEESHEGIAVGGPLEGRRLTPKNDLIDDYTWVPHLFFKLPYTGYWRHHSIPPEEVMDVLMAALLLVSHR